MKPVRLVKAARRVRNKVVIKQGRESTLVSGKGMRVKCGDDNSNSIFCHFTHVLLKRVGKSRTSQIETWILEEYSI